MSKGQSFSPHILIGSSLFNYFRWLLKLNFSIKFSSVIRLIISFFILILLAPFRLIESLLYLFSKKEEVKQPVFIIGHPRSGTTYFHDSLNELDSMIAPKNIDCLFPYLNKYFKFMLVPILKKVLPETRLMDKMKMKWDSPQEEEFGMALTSLHSSVSFLFAPKQSKFVLDNYVLLNNERFKSKWLSAHQRLAKKLQTINKGKTLVFKSPGNTARMAELLEVYPDAKFIHIVRNPHDVIPSTINLYNKILPEFSLQDETSLDLNSFVFDYYEKVMDKYMSSINNLSQNQLAELKYEDFVANPIDTIKSSFSKIELEFPSEQLLDFFEARKNFKRNSFKRNEVLAKNIEKRCKKVLEHYNYDQANN